MDPFDEHGDAVAEYRAYLVRRALPLVPAWLYGLYGLVTRDAVWVVTEYRDDWGEPYEVMPGWIVLGVLVVGSLAYAFAPFLGARLAAVTPSSTTAHLGQPSPLQRAFGVGVTRIFALFTLYVVLLGILYELE